MKVLCTPLKTSEQEILEQLRGEGKFNFNQALIRGKQVTGAELRYVEYFILQYNMIHRRGFFRKPSLQQAYSRQTVYLLGNGSTGYTSVMEVLPETEVAEVDESQLQPADYGPDKMSLNARITMLKMYRRRVGGRIPDFELVEAKSLYRPFWLVYYGEPKHNGKRLCSVRAGDGFTVGKFG